MKKTYFTKCNRKFQKSSTAEVTGYKIDLEDPDHEECKTCPFRIEVKKGWQEVFDHWECRAGSEHPNDTNDWLGNSDDKTSLHVMSLDHEYLTNVIVYCETHEDITGVSYSNDEKDCRRCLSIGFAQNKKGIDAKQKFLKLFFDVEVPEKDTRSRKEKLAALSKACDEQAAKSESKRTHYDKWDKRNNQEKNPIKEGGSMFNEEFEAVLKSVSSKTAYKQIDGMRTKESAYKIVVESCDIDYGSVEKDMPSVYAYLTAMKDQLTFKTIGFGAVPVMDLSLEMRGMNADGEFEYSARELGLAKITNMSITAKYNIPYYMFVIEISDEVSGTYLLRNLKSSVKIKFNKPQSLFESVEIKES